MLSYMKGFITRFLSNYFENANGFKIEYNSTKTKPDITYRIGECGGSFKTQKGVMTSPLYPEKFPNEADCVYTITKENGTYINITIIALDIPDILYSQCNDYIEIRDGASQSHLLWGNSVDLTSQHQCNPLRTKFGLGKCIYREEINSLQIQLSTTQAGARQSS